MLNQKNSIILLPDNQSTEPGVSADFNKPKKSKAKKEKTTTILTKPVANIIWLSISEAAKIGGVQNKTVRRAISSKALKYKIIGNKYYVELSALVQYLHTNTKLKNKLLFLGIGQYVDKWRE